ncbi:NAD(P)/FAD-dependent oxidoreductase [Streptomyces scabiei]|uniref:flavin-containing monooxygenase n=1 Tax=Streptomyces scabiei TaxID=1930 RepID=UPI00298F87C2|nr:NAD(P)/FAD-dependent oxidoreductase [Streptomyces scabiei]MDW8803286.1 NAD(P)/FAD-dependent oxidoreductase [Streptomyces scabiei]
MSPSSSLSQQSTDHFDVVIVGAGFAGMYMLYTSRELGLAARVYEAGGGVGGTWYWNRYPGARCDIDSMQYSYSFSDELQQEWDWSERYAAQPELLRYANHVADRFGLRPDIQFDTRIDRAEFDAGRDVWKVTTSGGDTVTARFVILATGVLSSAQFPPIKGIGTFSGDIYHTARWPHDPVDLTGRRVGLIGTGSSGVQATPVIAAQADHLTVFQRTANFSVPARNAKLTDRQRREIRSSYPEIRRFTREQSRTGVYVPLPDRGTFDDAEEARRARFEAQWERGGLGFLSLYNDLMRNQASNDAAAEFVREKIAQTVEDERTAKLLQPTTHPLGAKRLCVDTDYYATFNRPNVSLVDIRTDPIEEIGPDAVRTAAGDHKVDTLVFATGFDAVTGSIAKIDIIGRDGQHLRARWAQGPRTYLGLMTAGFPNLFIITGPGSPAGLTNAMVSIEQHVEWIGDCLAHLAAHGITTIEAGREAEDGWVAHVNEAASKTLYPRADSWFMGANIPGKPRVFLPYVEGVARYRQICLDVAERGYAGFVLNGAR